MSRTAVGVIIALACVLGLSATADADVFGQEYLGDETPELAISLRGSLHSISGIDPSAGSYFTESLDFDTDFGYGMAVEYWITPAISIEFSFDHVKIEDTFATRTVELGVNDWALSCKYTFTPTNRLRPYVLAGLDALLTNVDYGGTGIVLTNGDVADTVGFHFGGGLEYRFTDNLGLFAEVRYLIGEADINVTEWFSGIPATTSEETLEYNGFVGTIGLKLYW